ncbi:MAG: DUF5906 domain-containing protein [Comamonas sp.]
MAANYDDVLGQLQGFGLLVDDLDTGRLRRVRVEGEGRERKGWYLLRELRLDNGDDVLVGSYGVWRGAENNAQKVELKKHTLTAEQKTAMRERLAADRRRAEAARKAQADKAAQRASRAWKAAVAQGNSEYLSRKGVGGHGVRYSPQGALVIPMCDALGNVHGLQIIRGRDVKIADGQERREKEYWPQGLVKQGHFHLIGGVPQGLLLVGEGYATCASAFEATGIPTAVAFDANNLVPVCAALAKRYKGVKILVLADDDNTQKCQAQDEAKTEAAGKTVLCKAHVWLPDGPECEFCGQPHKAGNAGITCASAAALQVDGAWMAPRFADPAAVRNAWITKGHKANDFNDLHLAEGLNVVRSQVEARLLELNWRVSSAAPRTHRLGGGEKLSDLTAISDLGDLLERYSLVYGMGDIVFDHQEHILVGMVDMRNLCIGKDLHRTWQDHPDKSVVREEDVGFDPAGTDPAVKCNLWGGWPTMPKAGRCENLVQLLEYMCGGEANAKELFQWVLRWLAYPLQNPGAKMKTTVVVHGPQGTGKNMFFETVMRIYGRYGGVIDQNAIESQFNDWAMRKLFLIADEVVARAELYHVKNKLKTIISGETIRINPKNKAAHNEQNHANLVFLSNETLPVVLEEDDRRHAVIWTPAKLPQEFYAELKKEIANGGVQALYDHLLHLDLGDFNDGTLPPMTEAKRSLIELSKDSPSKFVKAFEDGDIEGFPGLHAPKLLSPMLSGDLYELYKHWCARSGLKALNQPRFGADLNRKHKVRVERKRYTPVDSDGFSLADKGPAAVSYFPGGHELPTGEAEKDWLSTRIDVFRRATRDYAAKVM